MSQLSNYSEANRAKGRAKGCPQALGKWRKLAPCSSEGPKESQRCVKELLQLQLCLESARANRNAT